MSKKPQKLGQEIMEKARTAAPPLSEPGEYSTAVIKTHECYPDCKLCKGTGYVRTPAKVTGDVERWATCPRVYAYESDLHWTAHQHLYGLQNVYLEGKHALEIRFPAKPWKGQEEAHAHCKKILAEVPPQSWGLLLGEYGRGKSHLIVAMVNEYRLRKQGAIYVQAADIVQEIQDTFESQEKASTVRSIYETVGFLAVDEIDAVKWSEWVGAELFNIFEARRLAQRSTIFATNASIQTLQDMSPALRKLMSRVAGNGEIIAIEGVDHRMEKR